MKAVIDRFEGDLAVLTPVGGAGVFSIKRGELPQGAAAGCTVERQAEGWVILADETEARRRRVAEKARRLFRESE